jgi:hypothetical protein
MWTPQEIDVVSIPEIIADRERVKPQGTVVWYVDGAPYATVECQCTDDNPDGLKTKLLDVQLLDLRPL